MGPRTEGIDPSNEVQGTRVRRAPREPIPQTVISPAKRPRPQSPTESINLDSDGDSYHTPTPKKAKVQVSFYHINYSTHHVVDIKFLQDIQDQARCTRA
jgi:hypothetical protein